LTFKVTHGPKLIPQSMITSWSHTFKCHKIHWSYCNGG